MYMRKAAKQFSKMCFHAIWNDDGSFKHSCQNNIRPQDPHYDRGTCPTCHQKFLDWQAARRATQ